jgi:hypothetical protein
MSRINRVYKFGTRAAAPIKWVDQLFLYNPLRFLIAFDALRFVWLTKSPLMPLPAENYLFVCVSDLERERESCTIYKVSLYVCILQFWERLSRGPFSPTHPSTLSLYVCKPLLHLTPCVTHTFVCVCWTVYLVRCAPDQYYYVPRSSLSLSLVFLQGLAMLVHWMRIENGSGWQSQSRDSIRPRICL